MKREIAGSLGLLDIFRLRLASRAALETFTPLLIEAVGRVIKVEKKCKVLLEFIDKLERERSELPPVKFGRLLRRVGVSVDGLPCSTLQSI